MSEGGAGRGDGTQQAKTRGRAGLPLEKGGWERCRGLLPALKSIW